MKQILLLSVLVWMSSAGAAEPVQFARDILPILSANCFACHGPDEHERQAGLRLDLEADAKATRDGVAAIVPHEVDASTIIERMTSDDPDQVMPPPESHQKVKPEQIELIRRWIAEGAPWQRHWSFEPIVKPKGSLDDLVRRQLAKHQMSLKPNAAPESLVRRLSLDLLGLPPSQEQAEAFARDHSPAAYERLVDELLEQPQFGEHWARMWLDLARYADTKGYEKDLGRTMWPYRDWVIDAYNADMPLDQFTIEQLAGDLLPNPTQSQLTATAFHRNTMANDEGGTDDEEFRSLAVKDRIDTTVQVWMGLTMGCAKCHTHKYDPISHAAYYQFYGLFNQTEDADRFDDEPRLPLLSDFQRTEQSKLLAEVEKRKAQKAAVQAAIAMEDEKRWNSLVKPSAMSHSGAQLEVQPEGTIKLSGAAPDTDTYEILGSLAQSRVTAIRLEALLSPLSNGKQGVGPNPSDPNFVVSEFELESVQGNTATPIKLEAARADFSQGGWPVTAALDGDLKTGWAISPRQNERHVAIFQLVEPLTADSQTRLRIRLVQNYGSKLILAHFRISTSDAPVETLHPLPESDSTRLAHADLEAAEKRLNDFNQSLPRLPIMRELAADRQRKTAIHRRGNFLDPGDEVKPDVLTEFGELPVGTPRNRLGAAQWLVNLNNPLTPRVWANRIWARLFGIGIVETEEDFGALGSPPSNPELLDWLAATYRDGGWSLKNLIKTIVMSDTYRQTSEIDASLRASDPRNLLFSRGARYRLSGEAVRDQTLSIAGLLSLKQGGAPVMPAQPSGLWRSTYNGQKWVDAEGEDRYRRSLYTYLKRTTPYPTLTTFDGGSGEVCQIRRIRTNTPLQALVTMNDPTHLEAAAAFASRLLAEPVDTKTRAMKGLRLALIRPIDEREAEPLVRLHDDALAAFAASPQQAEAFVQAARGPVVKELVLKTRGNEAKPAVEIEPPEYAAWIVVANAIFNLDEFLTRN